jgi:hypothetical protein
MLLIDKALYTSLDRLAILTHRKDAPPSLIASIYRACHDSLRGVLQTATDLSPHQALVLQAILHLLATGYAAPLPFARWRAVHALTVQLALVLRSETFLIVVPLEKEPK